MGVLRSRSGQSRREGLRRERTARPQGLASELFFPEGALHCGGRGLVLFLPFYFKVERAGGNGVTGWACGPEAASLLPGRSSVLPPGCLLEHPDSV